MEEEEEEEEERPVPRSPPPLRRPRLRGVVSPNRSPARRQPIGGLMGSAAAAKHVAKLAFFGERLDCRG